MKRERYESWECPNCGNINKKIGPIYKCELCLKEYKRVGEGLIEVKRVHKGYILMVLPIILIIAVFLSFISIEYSSNPRICEVCHVMESYFNAWNESTHRDVKCYKCHYGEGVENFLEGSFHSLSVVLPRSTPFKFLGANISDENCILCHKDVFLIGDVASEIGGKTIYFNHSRHLMEYKRGIIKLNCVSCHSQIVVGSHIAVTNSTCLICHFEHTPSGFPVSGCPSCHPYPSENLMYGGKTFSHSIHVNREIPCEMCHSNISIKKGIMDEKCEICHPDANMTELLNLYEVHGVHVNTYKVKCIQCHPEIIHKPEVKKDTCKICHPER
jgi:hypothetical protein